MLDPYPGCGAGDRSYRSSGYGYECRTELTEVVCTGIDVVQTSQKFRVRIIPEEIYAFGEAVRFEVENSIQFAWHVLTGPTSPRQSAPVWALSAITTEAINRARQRVATGATAALTATDHSTAHPSGGASKKIMTVASTILPPARSAKCHDNQAKRPKTQDSLRLRL